MELSLSSFDGATRAGSRGEELALDELAAILTGTYGLNREVVIPGGIETRLRMVPSAGALYPLELYLVLQRVETIDDGLYHYNVRDHALVPLRAGIDSTELARAVLAAPLLETPTRSFS